MANYAIGARIVCDNGSYTFGETVYARIEFADIPLYNDLRKRESLICIRYPYLMRIDETWIEDISFKSLGNTKIL